MRQIFVETGKLAALDELRADVATFLDLPGDARAARRIRPQFFTGGRAIALYFPKSTRDLVRMRMPSLRDTMAIAWSVSLSGICCLTE